MSSSRRRYVQAWSRICGGTSARVGPPPKDADERFDESVRAFRAPRFKALYRAWLERGDEVLDAAMSVTLADAITRQLGELDCHVLPHRYLHLLPLVGTA